MRGIFINSAVSISAQNTFEGDLFDMELPVESTKTISAIHPNYKEYISPAASRRMATGVKMGVTAAKRALNIAGVDQPDAIITGTGMGCIEDSEKFLNAIIENDEEFLTPTSFIQSTHNTVGAQIALGMKCQAYNMTYVHDSVSFESAVLDAQLWLDENEAKDVLIGGVDELGKQFINEMLLLEENIQGGIAVPFGEGANFFVLSVDKGENCTAKLLSLEIVNRISEKEINQRTYSFLEQNDMVPSDIDAVILGYNGDCFDIYYDSLHEMFKDSAQVQYKFAVGEFYTSSAYAFWLGTQIIRKEEIPQLYLKHNKTKSDIKTILLYNQFKGKQHSFTLITAC